MAVCGGNNLLRESMRNARANVEHSRKALRRLLIDIQQGSVSRAAVTQLNRGLLRATEKSISRILICQNLSNSDRDRVQYYSELVATFSEVLTNLVGEVDQDTIRRIKHLSDRYASDVDSDDSADSRSSGGDSDGGGSVPTDTETVKPSSRKNLSKRANHVQFHGNSMPHFSLPPPPATLNATLPPVSVSGVAAHPANVTATPDKISVSVTDGLTFYVQSIMDNLKSFTNFLNEHLSPIDYPVIIVQNVRSLLILLLTLMSLVVVFLRQEMDSDCDEDDQGRFNDRDESDETSEETEFDQQMIIQILVVIIAIVLLGVDSVDRHYLQRKSPKIQELAPNV